MRVQMASLLLAALVSSLLPSPAQAHGMRSAYLEIVEHDPGRALLRFKRTVPAPAVRPVLPADCTLVAYDNRAPSGDETAAAYVATCPYPLAGHEVGVDGLGPLLTEAVVYAELAGGAAPSAYLLTPSSARARLADSGPAALAVGRRYVALGVVHIATGADHLLFLLLLVLTLRRPRAVLLAETAFTLSHSLAFSATALGWIAVAPAAAETCIALSIVLVALDVERRGAPALTTGQGALLAFVFGLVHGLGFAGGLREIGVPDVHAAWALVGFGAGVELAQLAFVLLLLAAWRAVTRLRPRAVPQLRVAVAYGAGAVASFWLLERALVLFHPLP
jgi:hypothetical protein